MGKLGDDDQSVSTASIHDSEDDIKEEILLPVTTSQGWSQVQKMGFLSPIYVIFCRFRLSLVIPTNAIKAKEVPHWTKAMNAIKAWYFGR